MLEIYCTSIPSQVLVSIIGASFIFKQFLEGNMHERMSLSAETDGLSEEGHLGLHQTKYREVHYSSRPPSRSSWGLSLTSNT